MHRLLFCHTLPPLLQSKATSTWVHHILRLNASPKKENMFMPLKTSEPSGTSQSICARTFRNLTEYLHRNPPERTLRNLTRYLHRSPPKPDKVSPPKPSGTSPGTRTWTFWNLTRNPPEPHQVSASEPSKTSQGICTGTLWHLHRYLHLNFLEP